MAQIASSVPKRVRFTSITFMDNNTVQIKGEAYGDNDILKLISILLLILIIQLFCKNRDQKNE